MKPINFSKFPTVRLPNTFSNRRVLLALILLATGLFTAGQTMYESGRAYGVWSIHSVVLFDGGINESLYSSNILDEACFVEWSQCSNSRSSMEGPGAAQQAPSANLEANHGQELLSIMVKVNPAIKVIPIKIYTTTPAGNPYIYSLASVKSALDWVVANRAKFNIGYVNISQGRIFAGCAVPPGFAEDINTLQANNVVVVAATGNSSNRTTMFTPACLPNVVSVGATDNPDPGVSGKTWDPTAKPYIARYSDGNDSTTVYSNARYKVTNLDGKTTFMVGTSNSTAAVTAWMSLQQPTTWANEVQNLKTSASGTASNEWLKGRYLFIASQ